MKTWVAIALVGVSMVAGPQATSLLADPCPQPPLPRPPIMIQGDAGFTLPGSGVVAGSGTPDDPFVICGWDIVPLGRDGIRLDGTTAHAVIRGNYVHGALVEVKVYKWPGDQIDHLITGGINLHNVSHARVADNVVANNTPVVGASLIMPELGDVVFGMAGIVVEYSDHVTLSSNFVHRNAAQGIVLRKSDAIYVDGNTLTRNNRFGPFASLHASGVTGLTVEGNRFLDTHTVTAVYLDTSPGALVRANRIDNPSVNGVGVTYLSDGVLVEGNLITGAQIGVQTSNAAGLVVRGNDIVGNARFGVQSQTHAVDAEGNWWGCADGPGGTGCNGVEGDVDFTPWATEPITD